MNEKRVSALKKNIAICMIAVLAIPIILSGLSSFDTILGEEITWQSSIDPAEEEREEERNSENESNEKTFDEFSIPIHLQGIFSLDSDQKGRSNYLATTIAFVRSIPYPPPELFSL